MLLKPNRLLSKEYKLYVKTAVKLQAQNALILSHFEHSNMRMSVFILQMTDNG